MQRNLSEPWLLINTCILNQAVCVMLSHRNSAKMPEQCPGKLDSCVYTRFNASQVLALN